MKKAVEGSDASSVQRTAHILKGSSGNMGATVLSHLFEQLQATPELPTISSPNPGHLLARSSTLDHQLDVAGSRELASSRSGSRT